MNLLADIEDFVHDYRPHGPLTGGATEPGWNGYLLMVTCLCGVVFLRSASRKWMRSWTCCSREG